MLPSIFGRDLFDDWFNDPFGAIGFPEHHPFYGSRGKSMMKTDIRETENGYELDIDLPGFKKEDIQAHVGERLSHHPCVPEQQPGDQG